MIHMHTPKTTILSTKTKRRHRDEHTHTQTSKSQRTPLAKNDNAEVFLAREHYLERVVSGASTAII